MRKKRTPRAAELGMAGQRPQPTGEAPTTSSRRQSLILAELVVLAAVLAGLEDPAEPLVRREVATDQKSESFCPHHSVLAALSRRRSGSDFGLWICPGFRRSGPGFLAADPGKSDLFWSFPPQRSLVARTGPWPQASFKAAHQGLTRLGLPWAGPARSPPSPPVCRGSRPQAPRPRPAPERRS